MIGTIGTTMVLATATLGWSDHHAAKDVCCDVCGVESAAVATQIQRLLTCPNRHDRENAAARLRKFGWKCHPEIPAALVSAMLADCHEEVREEAAESLAKLKPCLPEVHAALARAVECDPDWATRHWARKGLKAIGKHCDAPCDVCTPGIEIEPSFHAPVVVGPARVGPPVYDAPIPSEPRLEVDPAPAVEPAPGLVPGPEIPIPDEAAPSARSPFTRPTAERSVPRVPARAALTEDASPSPRRRPFFAVRRPIPREKDGD